METKKQCQPSQPMPADNFPKTRLEIHFSFPFIASLYPWTGRQTQAAVRAMLAEACARGYFCAALDLYFVDDAAIAWANERRLGRRGPTNVLSFPGCGMPGSLLISLDACRRESLLYGQTVKTRILRLLAHGLAHLAGLGHGAEMDNLASVCFRAASEALECWET